MGICESTNKAYSNKNQEINHIQTPGNPDTHGYKFECIQKDNFSNNKKLNLKFIFYNFKVKYCISHKPTRDSIYITEIKIGQKIFPLIINKGQSPSIPNLEDIQNGYFEQKDYTINELENTYFLINVYEFLEDIPNLSNNLLGLPEEYKQKCNYNSFFRISLLSFLFKSIKCDFAMMGTNQLSTKTRISFYCFIEHREKITIKAGSFINPNYTKLIFKTKDINLNSTKQPDNYFVITTPPITMLELQRADIFLETNETYQNYSYQSLNSLKASIIRQLGEKILKEESNLNDLNLHNPVDIRASYTNSNAYNNNFGNNPKNLKINYIEQQYNKQALLYFENLPIIAQISNLFFTEYGNIYSTSILNLINNDLEINNYRKEKQISSIDFYNKLNGYLTELSKPNYDFGILNELYILLMKSIDNDKFMYLYPNMDSLNQMIFLLLNIGLKIIEKIINSTEEYQIIVLSKIINILMRREELDNGVLCECIKRCKSSPNNIENLYSLLINNLFILYQLLLSNKLAPNNDTSLIELYSRLYFQKKYFRQAILCSIYKDEYKFNEENYQNDIFLYDVINDERLNHYLTSDTTKSIKNFFKSKKYFNNVEYDNYKIIKRIISFINEANINQYPLDFIIFSDNLNILKIMGRDINEQKYDRPDKIKLSNDFYESLMLLSNSYDSISSMNNSLIQSTNGHNSNAVYVLFIYFKSLFDYYYTLTGGRLVMDYSTFELACQMLTENEDSLSLPRLFWFYYCCGHMMLSGNLKWFIINIINKKFDKFAYHWSFTIRQVFFKLILFIINDRLKNEEGKCFMAQKLNPFLYRNINNNIINPYIGESYKDFDIIKKEYDEWNEKNVNNINKEYPQFFLPPPISTGNID